jgi:hypothetical protein
MGSDEGQWRRQRWPEVGAHRKGVKAVVTASTPAWGMAVRRPTWIDGLKNEINSNFFCFD